MFRRTFCSLVAFALVSVASPQAQHGPSTAPSDPPAPASQVIDAAVKRAAAETKTVWVDFGASWCGWCRKLEAFLAAPEVKPIIDKHYVLVNLTVMESKDKKALENPGGSEVMESLGGKGAGLPFYAYLDGSGQRLANSMAMAGGGNIGFPANQEELDAFMSLFDKTAPRLSADERGQLVAYLNKVVLKK
jgi:thiol-disulfide isomerase/thioredoxin